MPDHKYEFCVSFDLYNYINIFQFFLEDFFYYSNGVTEKNWKNPGTGPGTGRYDADPGTGRVFIFIPVAGTGPDRDGGTKFRSRSTTGTRYT